ncbi:MAG: hypothetical protein J6Y20_10260 [Lachnospiraceae bacterium]|nr:hypothetical protein [Lachnospiraceae bacterium]MBP5462497.1 hypothetical protein [Lachnospiraceae bacterium]
MFDIICDVLHHELDEMEDKFDGGAKLTMQDLEAIDKTLHSLKSLATYEAMKESKRKSRYRDDEYRRY